MHPEVEALRSCARCGAFMCRSCEFRVRLDAQPLCPACWNLRNEKLAQREPENALATIGLGVGLFAVPLIVVLANAGVVAVVVGGLGAVALNAVALRRRTGRLKAIAGLVLSLVALSLGLFLALRLQ